MSDDYHDRRDILAVGGPSAGQILDSGGMLRRNVPFIDDDNKWVGSYWLQGGPDGKLIYKWGVEPK